MNKIEGLQHTKTSKNERPLTSNLTLEERLKVIANLIVDRIIEDQINGKLRFKNKPVQQP